MVKVTKFVDPTKRKAQTRTKTTNLNIDSISRKGKTASTTNFTEHLTKTEQKFIDKRKEIESGIAKDAASRGPRAKKELSRVQLDIHKVSLEAHSKEEQRRIEAKRLIGLGARKPKQHKNYKDLQVGLKEKQAEFDAGLKQMSEAEARIVQRKETDAKKKAKEKKEKGDRRFFNISGKGGLKSGGGKLGKIQGNGTLRLSKADLKKMTS